MEQDKKDIKKLYKNIIDQLNKIEVKLMQNDTVFQVFTPESKQLITKYIYWLKKQEDGERIDPIEDWIYSKDKLNPLERIKKILMYLERQYEMGLYYYNRKKK